MAHSEFLSVAVQAARRASDIILQNLGKLQAGDVAAKQASDFVTRVDQQSEEAIISTIRQSFREHAFLGEESLKDDDTGGYRWIIDPLDGTTNFIHGYPMFAVSIALQHEGQVVLAVVLDPLRDELFHALKGQGAFLGEKRLSVSAAGSPGGCLVATGFPFRHKDMLEQYLQAFKLVFQRVADIRRAGSAALDLAHLGAGRCDGFFELGLGPWDIAAGSLIITEAGGVITDFSGGDGYLLSGNVVAGNPSTHAMLMDIIKEVFQGTVPE